MALASNPRSRLFTTITGFISDLVLLAVFLIFGITLLNILIQVVVLSVGVAREMSASTAHLKSIGFIEETAEAGRVWRDTIDLGISFLHAILAGGIYWTILWLRRKYLHLFGAVGFESFVSKRYLLAREGGRLVGLISVVSVLGVAVGTMALIVVISVMEGFDQTLVKKFMGVFSHIEILPDPRYTKSTEIPKDVYTKLVEEIRKKDFVKGVAPVISHQTIVQATLGADERKEFALFRGIDPELEKTVTEFMSYVKEGDPVPGYNQVVLGAEIARRLDVRVGSRIYAIGRVVPTANRTAAKTTTLEVTGIFTSGLYDVDDKFIYTSIPTIQDMLLVDESVTSIHLSVDDPERVNEYGNELVDLVPYGYGYRTWQMINPQFFEALWMEKVAMFIILLLIVLVAALNIIGTLVMTVVQKTRDIGILKSMGAGRTSIMRIFLFHGFFIGLLGTSLGTVWGLRLCRFVSKDIDKIFELPPGVYGLDRLPVVIDPMIISFMAGSALLICIVAAIIPAWQASRLHPVEALRYDA